MNTIGSLFERALTLLMVLLLAPVFLMVALMVLCRDGRPILFRQTRIGQGGAPFEILKFRTMSVDNAGSLITGGGDPRITANGALLRRSKLDEMPQLWNVVRGDMQLVGPRPEVKKYVDMYDERQRRVLDSKPGITDVASLAFRNEESLLEGVADPANFYIQKLMPAKIELNLEYAARRNIFSDLGVIGDTFLVVAGLKSPPLPEGFEQPAAGPTGGRDE
jgi:lipopolysaccharide/colanic/teichoic acid biosynthesis glycosyltransferase